jgi:hypothetical protein
MQSRSASEITVFRHSSNRKLSSNDPSKDEEDEDNIRESEEHYEDSEERSSTDEDVSMSNSGDDVESMDDDPADEAHILSYQQHEAMKKLSSVFQLLNLDPIHDR